MIIQHVLIYLNPSKSSFDYLSFSILEAVMLISKSAVPLFVMISGAIFLHNEKTYTVTKGLHLAKRMIFIILFWNIIAAIYNAAMGDGLKDIMSGLIFGKWWYLYMLVGLYLYMTIADLIIRNNSVTKFVVISFLLFELYISISLVLPEPIQSPVTRLVNKFFPQFFMTNIGTVLIGSCIYRPSKVFTKEESKLFAIIYAIATFILYIHSIKEAVFYNELNYIFFDEATAMVIAGIILYFGLKLLKCDKKPKGLFKKSINYIGTHSLGMYAISNLLLEVCERFKVYSTTYGNLLVGNLLLGGGVDDIVVFNK